MPETESEDGHRVALAEKIDDAAMLPSKKPRPRPDVKTRPTRFSVTEIETLLRDPYGIYAKRILRLDPLEGTSATFDPRVRGTLFHAAIAEWTKQQSRAANTQSLNMLLEAGSNVMRPLMADPEVSSFWVPAFARMAAWLVEEDQTLRRDVLKVFAEVSGKIAFPIGSTNHILTARADRIDVLANDSLRIVDYKTGEVPTSQQVLAGFSPQLLLEAAVVKLGGFESVPAKPVSELLYIKLSGGRVPGELHQIEFKDSTIDEKVMQQFERLKGHLANYQSSEIAYLPRRAPKNEMQDLPYDHLSRFAEWILAEE